jgi:cephalosporin-C deacetylase-like acetyl esterase
MSWKRKSLFIFLTLTATLSVAAILYLRLPLITTEAVKFKNGDVTLAGTLLLPRRHDGPYPAAVVVHGSGPMPRWAYWLNAMRLVPEGMAVLIYDKRGTGRSTGENPQDLVFDKATGELDVANAKSMLDILAGDALAAVTWIASHNKIDSSRIGLVGVSQAGWIMPLAASQSDKIKFIVSLVGPAVSVGIEHRFSDLTGDNPASPYRDQLLSDEEIEKRLSEYTGPAYYDPVPVLRKLKTPILWLFGRNDRSMPTARSVANVKQLVTEDEAPFDLIVYSEENHFLCIFKDAPCWPDVRQWLNTKKVLPYINNEANK